MYLFMRGFTKCLCLSCNIGGGVLIVVLLGYDSLVYICSIVFLAIISVSAEEIFFFFFFEILLFYY